MRARTSLLLSGGILAIVALLGATNVSAITCASSECGPPPPPLVDSIGHQTMANGCSYLVTVNDKGEIIGMDVDPAGPMNATIPPYESCAVVKVEYDICESETGLAYCPLVRRGHQPIQGALGGICYYPRNIKITC